MAEAHASVFSQILIFLTAAVVAVPLFRWLRLGSILGYLAAGLVIGPRGLGLFSDAESIMHVAELGVVLFLFLIGLELNLSRLWAMRRDIFVLGTAQLVLTGLLAMIYPLLVVGRSLAGLADRRPGAGALVDRARHAAARGEGRGADAARAEGVRHPAAAGPGRRAAAGAGGHPGARRAASGGPPVWQSALQDGRRAGASSSWPGATCSIRSFASWPAPAPARS